MNGFPTTLGLLVWFLLASQSYGGFELGGGSLISNAPGGYSLRISPVDGRSINPNGPDGSTFVQGRRDRGGRDEASLSIRREWAGTITSQDGLLEDLRRQGLRVAALTLPGGIVAAWLQDPGQECDPLTAERLRLKIHRGALILNITLERGDDSDRGASTTFGRLFDQLRYLNISGRPRG